MFAQVVESTARLPTSTRLLFVWLVATLPSDGAVLRREDVARKMRMALSAVGNGVNALEAAGLLEVAGAAKRPKRLRVLL